MSEEALAHYGIRGLKRLYRSRYDDQSYCHTFTGSTVSWCYKNFLKNFNVLLQLREAQTQVEELQNQNKHLTTRLDRIKQSRTALGIQ